MEFIEYSDEDDDARSSESEFGSTHADEGEGGDMGEGGDTLDSLPAPRSGKRRRMSLTLNEVDGRGKRRRFLMPAGEQTALVYIEGGYGTVADLPAMADVAGNRLGLTWRCFRATLFPCTPQLLPRRMRLPPMMLRWPGYSPSPARNFTIYIATLLNQSWRRTSL